MVKSAAEAGYKLSEYNLFKNSKDNKYIQCVNLMKGTYSELEPIDILNLYNLEKINYDDNNLKFFIKQGIIVNYNEKELLKSMALRVNSSTRILKITIAVTMSCNFNCPYCFEFHKNGKMTIETQENIIRFIEKTLKSFGAKTLNITWYGGEPLLVSDIIENLSEKILTLVEKNNITYNSSIITNGYYFTQKNVDILEKSKVTSCQITLDGLRENHDYTRSLKNGDPTFDIIINNLYNVKFKGIINIRHNINENNKEDGTELKKLILDINEKTGNNIFYYPAIVINNPAEKRDKQVNFLNNENNAKIEAARDVKRFSSSRCTFCGAQTMWSFCIDNEGLLYKCWEDVGKIERSFGNVEKWNPNNPFNTSDNLDILTMYLNSMGIMNIEECYDCIWLPFCAGGCASKRIFCNIKCVGYKENPDLFIDKVSEKYKNKNIKD